MLSGFSPFHIPVMWKDDVECLTSALTVRARKIFHNLTTLHFSQTKWIFYRNSIALIILNFLLITLTLHRCWDFFFFLSELYGIQTLSLNVNAVVSQFLNLFVFSFQKEIFWACFLLLLSSFCVLCIFTTMSSISYYFFPFWKVWQDPLV